LLVPPLPDELPDGVGVPAPPVHAPPLHDPPAAVQSWHWPDAPQAESDVPATHVPVASQQPLHVEGSHVPPPLSSPLPLLLPLAPVAPVLPVLPPASSLYPDDGPEGCAGEEASPLLAPVDGPGLLKPVVLPTSPAAQAGASAAITSESPPRWRNGLFMGGTLCATGQARPRAGEAETIMRPMQWFFAPGKDRSGQVCVSPFAARRVPRPMRARDKSPIS
jgi:hypothetical protein